MISKSTKLALTRLCARVAYALCGVFDTVGAEATGKNGRRPIKHTGVPQTLVCYEMTENTDPSHLNLYSKAVADRLVPTEVVGSAWANAYKAYI